MSTVTARPARWRDDAACAGTDPEAFFPERYTEQTVAPAVRVCSDCLVADLCLEDALSDEGAMGINDRAGVRGSLTPRQRHALSTARARAAREVGEPARKTLRPIQHGAGGGAAAHRRRGERACVDCLSTENARHRQRAAERRAAALTAADHGPTPAAGPSWLATAHRNRLELDITRRTACVS